MRNYSIVTDSGDWTLAAWCLKLFYNVSMENPYVNSIATYFNLQNV